MIDSRFLAFANGVQAMRRRIEGQGLGICGALGVAGEPYPYQISTVRRILASTRIRHLIADEVGMGKTVQALMVLNALRMEKPQHRTVILTPPRLIDQWHKECWTRAHIKASVFDGSGELDEDFVRIINPQTLQSRRNSGDEGFEAFALDPDFFDLLIVDEPQLLPIEVIEAVQRASRDFRQVLLLSASPRLGEPNSRNRILSILEPERAMLAEASGKDLDGLIDGLEETALKEVAEDRLDGRLAFEQFSRSRRIIRSTRKQWPDFFPKRKYEAVVSDPIDGDVGRLRHGLDWLANDSSSSRDYWSNAQTLHRGSRSVRSLLTRPDLEDTESRRLALEFCDSGPGDARLDVLLDILRSIWERDQSQQVVIVAGDNPTIDFVSSNIRRFFGEGTGISTLRRPAGGANEALDDIREMQEAMARFSAGEDQVLFVGEWVQAGINLHYFASNIVFYNPPWDQNAIDQLIGRLDRLRPNALFKGERGKDIRIWTIVQPDTPESRVVAGLTRLGLFDEPMPPVPPDTAEDIRRALEDLAMANSQNDAFARLERIGDEIHETARISRLDDFAPPLTELATQHYAQLQGAYPPEPVISSKISETFTQKSEAALVGWLKFLSRARLFMLQGRKDKHDPETRFMTFWYQDTFRKAPPAIRLTEMEGTNWMSDHIPFLSRLRDLHRPPLMVVHTDDGEPEGRPLRFFSHGDSIHDDLIEQSLKAAREACSEDTLEVETIRFDEDNAAANRFRSKPVLAAAFCAEASAIGLPDQVFESYKATAEEIISEALGEGQRARLRSLFNLVTDWWRTDRRWLNLHLEPIFEVSAFFLAEDVWKVLPSAALLDLMKGDVDREKASFPRAYGNPHRIDASLVEEALEDLYSSQEATIRARWADSLRGLEDAVSHRLVVLAIEGDDLLSILKLNVERARKRAEVDDERQRQMQLGQLEAAERILRLAEVSIEARRSWLKGMTALLGEPIPDRLGTALFRPVPYQN
ncbi:DEAD/DEAH box helicase family protein [Erythrobacter aurantius]|uniref:DEAD/DEAH box helicase family protein n=1 Tax=Erythrobacter aurantius TaxID=2909249 RepID=UPI00207A83FD|nr:DEAD/DEAH box helicase family protein [Erythrobacter aurantius]